METVEKILKIKGELNKYFIEREEEIDLLLTAIIARQHCLFLGPPGTAKGFLIRAVASHIDGCIYFERLLTKFSTPEELFGPYDLKELTEGKYFRVTTRKLPEAHIAFVDEVFKASSAILNTLLSIMADRIFYNDSVPVKVPLISLISASNELPEEDEPLQALYDRFLLRKTVEYISDHTSLSKLLDLPDEYKPKTKITLDELKALSNEANNVDISNVKTPLLTIRRELAKNGIVVSDRRLKWAVKAIKAKATMAGKSVADLNDLTVLNYVFWDTPEQIPQVKTIIYEVINPYGKKAMEILAILDEFEKSLAQYTEVTADVLEIYNKVAKIEDNIKDLIDTASAEGKPTHELEKVLEKATALKEHIAVDIMKLKR